MLIRNALLLNGSRVDIRFNQRIEAIASGLDPQPGEETRDATGHLLLPGLHDHHLHFLAYAASLNSVDCSAPALEQTDALLVHLRTALTDQHTSLRAIGYHEGSASLLDRAALDSVSRTVPIRVQHRTGRLWIYNSAAINELGIDDFPDGAERDSRGSLTGRFFHVDDWLRARVPRRLPDLFQASRQLAALGITGFTDAGPDNNSGTLDLFRQAQKNGQLLQKVTMMGRPELDFDNAGLLALGPCKLYLKESELPDFDALCELIRQQHQRQRPVAFHCVTTTELHFALAALSVAGTCGRDRIEHASLCDDDALPLIQSLNLTVVSQPIFIAERGDRYRQSLAPAEQALLYRARSFIDAGIAFAGSSDAPFGSPSPWLSMRAAVRRLTPSGHRLGVEERLDSNRALALYLGAPDDPGRSVRTLTVGEPADLVLLNDAVIDFEKDPLPTVAATWIDGHYVFKRA